MSLSTGLFLPRVVATTLCKAEHRIKTEFFHLNRFDGIERLQDGIRRYIHYYNHERIKLKLKGLSPVEYRTQALSP